MKKIYLGFDTSLRSTGCVAIDEDGKVLSCLLIQPAGKDTFAMTELFVKSSQWMTEVKKLGKVEVSGLEMIALAGRSGSKEKLAAVKWIVHMLSEATHGFKTEVCAVNTWRARVITKPLRAEIKADEERFIPGWLKFEVQKLLPPQAKKFFDNYRRKNSFEVGEYDLSDAYFVANYYRNL